MIKETAEQRYTRLFEEMYEICNTEGWGDPFSYARSREIHMAGILGHRVADDYSGADAYDKYDLPVEYKSTIGKKLTATYNGISVQDTWEKQVDYILNEKYLPQRGASFLLNDKNQIIYNFFSNDVLGYSSNMRNPLEFLSDLVKG